ncbi:MAG TPA: ABC transporter substrate-binding protein [Acidimicrobiales bacterium]|nr:ABC transporter substrate-binding protein [Acidimicrobiales bacterium]
MSRNWIRVLAVGVPLALLAVACTEDDEPEGAGGSDGAAEEAAIDYDAIGLWDDGPCDAALPPLKIGLMTVFESPVISLGDQALALDAAAEAFNRRGGANGTCLEVHTCDDGANPDQSVECVREIVDAGVVVTVNDQGTQGQAEVNTAMSEAGIPRVGALISPNDWAAPNMYTLDAGGTGVAFVLPQALIDAGATALGSVRVDFASASALNGFLAGIYEGDATFTLDAPVSTGTTDYSQYILAAEDAEVDGVVLALGENEAIQVVRAGQQLDTQVLMGASLGSFTHAQIAKLGDFADRMVFAGSYPPATADVPVYAALRADLAASGEEALQPANLKASPMRSWIGLYALLRILRDSGTTDFTSAAITEALDQAVDVPMLDMFGGEDWTPALDHEGLITRSGLDFWASYRWDPDAPAPDGLEGNFVQTSEINFSAILCGSPLGAPEPC